MEALGTDRPRRDLYFVTMRSFCTSNHGVAVYSMSKATTAATNGDRSNENATSITGAITSGDYLHKVSRPLKEPACTFRRASPRCAVSTQRVPATLTQLRPHWRASSQLLRELIQ
jgi:hypothetical protein